MSGVLELRQALGTDASAIRDLTREAYAKWVPVIGREPKPMTADYAEALRKHRIDLLYLDGKLAALIETIAEPDHLLIENVAVSPAFQGRGLGRKLIAHAEQLAGSLGHDEIKLYTPTSSFPKTCCSTVSSVTELTGKRSSKAGLWSI
jgi:ribosomal protein S18 acetylase RimI-like enzyme